MHFDVFVLFSCVRGFEEEVRRRQNSHKRVKLCFYGVDGEMKTKMFYELKRTS